MPVQEEKKALWRKLNAKQPERPMVMIDQICWNEMNVDGELDLQCQDADARGWENYFRETLYKWKHFPADMVLTNYLTVHKAVENTGFGIITEEHILATDQDNNVLSHKYHNQFTCMDDVKKIKTPHVTYDIVETKRRMDLARECFDGIIEVRLNGVSPYLSVWDPIATWMGVENALYALSDEPEMMHAIVDRVVAGYMTMLDQMEALGVLEQNQALIHCTGAWSDELPGFSEEPAKLRDTWMFGLAQMFSCVSPEMFDEYEIEPNMPIFQRFGLVYYGCCDPLDGKMEQVRKIPHMRKVSMSPWVNKERGAAEIGRDYVYSCKPNPAFLSTGYDEDVIRTDLLETKQICDRMGCPLEFILKDISTVGHEPQRLWKWAQIAMEIAQG